VTAYRYPLIRANSTQQQHAIESGGRQLQYMNSNRLVRNSDWDIGLQKTGYIAEAGRCLVMQTRIGERPVVMILLDSKGRESRLGDASRIRKWLEIVNQQAVNLNAGKSS
jgi:serine-type D-Ala-D-Ala endopeptidase (penicillin-binding protein 7)